MHLIFNLAAINSSFMKSSRCMVSSSFSSTPKFNYIYEKEKKQLSKLDHKDSLQPNEVLKIFKCIQDPESVIPVFKKCSERKDYKPNEALYIVMIEKLARAQKFHAIEGLLDRIKAENCKLSEDFFHRLFEIYGCLMFNPKLSTKTLLRIPVFRSWHSVTAFNFVLNVLVSAKQFDVIHEVYLGASQVGIAVNTCCFNIFIKALCKCGKLDVAFALLDEFPKQGCKPNTKTYSTLMHCLCERKRVNEAFELFERMEREGCNPDTVIFNILIMGLCKQGKIDKGMELLDNMKLKGCIPDSGSYREILYGLLIHNKYVEAKNFMEQMIFEGAFPCYWSFKLAIEGLCVLNLLNELDFVLKQMVHQGFVPRMGLWRTILESMPLKIDY